MTDFADKEDDLELERRPCWLIWVLLSSGHQALRAVCLSKKTADAYQKYAAKLPNIERVMVEESRTDHLYFGVFEKGPLVSPEKVKEALRLARKNFRAKTGAVK